MNKNYPDSIDDFFVTLDSEYSFEELLSTYSEYKKQLNELPKKLSISDDETKLKFFREIHSRRKGEMLYRKRDDAGIALSVYWLSRVKELATYFALYNDVPKFEAINKDELRSIVQISSDVAELPSIEKILASKGIILVTEESLPGLKLDGAVFMLASGQAVVSLSLRYKRLDYFWFTLMHELAHLCLHSDKLVTGIIEDLDSKAQTLIELEADKLALNSSVPKNIWRNCPPKYDTSKETVISFANEMGVHPAIIAGRLRKELDRHDMFSDLVNKVDVRKYFF
jgi:HTH-type transcriptional regulator/antitoxin HigA